ncbi:hypothetical protein MSMEI_0460 [Mycolicibacterium smegmatis MC2 155]|uniref:Uncharacterized protein n=1 Tax=Mycolicibacterium smegmatis (strain ATCC 700084 / mc(2)155) TaxID=246196 RepID=I7G1W3_MYCS2|nr:hypothetical protein MSMEI_0460 [Mycolicibacterium smegmatis MC2 155]
MSGAGAALDCATADDVADGDSSAAGPDWDPQPPTSRAKTAASSTNILDRNVIQLSPRDGIMKAFVA